MIYLLLSAEDEETIMSFSSGEFVDFTDDYTQVSIETTDDDGEDLGNIPDGFYDDYSLYKYEDGSIVLIEDE